MSTPVRSRFSLRELGPRSQWGVLIGATLALVTLLLLVQLSAALLLGSLLAAIAVSAAEARLTVPEWPYRLAQGVIGCLVARSLNAGILREMIAHWPIFLFSVLSVIALSSLLGGLLARLQVLPGTTAVWGSAPGAATVMTLMAEGFGGDVRLVAFMQFLRVVMVAIVASIVARLWLGHGGGTAPALVWFPEVALGPLAATLAVAFAGAVLGTRLKFPAGALLVPMIGAIVLSSLHVFEPTLPPWLLAGCYALVGWAIGLRFTRDILTYAAHALPKVAASILTLIALCGGLAYVLCRITGTDALTAYLATSPGGADSIAIIAASAHVDLPFVMAMQTGRFVLVLLIGPSLARLVARWTAHSSE